MTTLIQLTQNLLFHNASLLAQVEYSTEGKPPSPLSMIVGLLIALLLIVAMWKVFTKAGQPGWASIIPRSTQQLRFVREPAARYCRGHGADFRFPRVKLKPD